MRHLNLILFSALLCPILAYSKPNVQQALAALEKSANGRLGVYAINTTNDQRIGYHANQRFALCSTAKLMTVAAILKKSMTENNLLNQRMHYTKSDVTSSGYAPITATHFHDGMTITKLCAAAIAQSDNAAMNLLVKLLGGPKKITTFARAIGDRQFRLDRTEPLLNTAVPGDNRDTSTPKAMAESVKKLTLGHVLAHKQRDLFITWLKQNTTGFERIRAGVAKGWVVADKTGTGDYGTTNDVAIIWPPNAAPIVIAIYFTQPDKHAAPNQVVIAEVTKVIASDLIRA
ncbi:MAG: class A beta-lactamase [Coxiellaceae bacterium]|nr:class A beta-lactamase [Coxiellaceae bacterium]